MTVRQSWVDGTDSGASAVEYSLLLVAIAAVIVIIVFALGGLVQDMFSDTCQRIDAQTQQAATSC